MGSDISTLNTTADLSGKTLVTAEGDRTITGLWTFSRGAAAAPFAVASGAGVVTNLDADTLDGLHAAQIDADKLDTHHAADFALLAGATFTGGVVAPTYNTVSSLESAASGNPTLLFSLPASAYAIYVVFAYLGVSDTANYGAVSLVTQLGTTAKITALQTAALMTLALSGLNVTGTQTSGSSTNIHYVVFKVA